MTEVGGRGTAKCEINWDDWQGPESPLGRLIAQENAGRLTAYRAMPRDVTQHYRHEVFLVSSGYRSRQIVELTQNSADTIPPTGGSIRVELTRDTLYFADDGRPLTESGVVALLNAFLSPRHAPDEIGRFGLGFKSLLRVSDHIEFYSRSGSFRFNHGWARGQILGVPGVGAAIDDGDTPSMRLAEPIDPREASEGDATLRALMACHTNIVKATITTDDGYDNLAQQLRAFPAEFLLLSDKVNLLELNDRESGYETRVSVKNDGDRVTKYLDVGGNMTKWFRFDVEHLLSSAAIEDRRMHESSNEALVSWAVPTNGSRGPSQFWAHFPITEPCLVSGILNARWNTNDDRTGLTAGTYNDELLEVAARLCADRLHLLSPDEDPGLHLDVLPRRRDVGDRRFSIELRLQMMQRLHRSDIVPDLLGDLRRPDKVFYPPVELVAQTADSPENACYRMWVQSKFAPSSSLHPSAITTERWVRVEELNDPRGRRANSGGDGAEHPSIAEWLGALLRNAAPSELPDASCHALQVAAALPKALRLDLAELGDICLTQSGELRPVNRVSLPLDSRSHDLFPEQVVHRNLSSDPATMGAFRELGVEALSPIRLLREALVRVTDHQFDLGGQESVTPAGQALYENLWAAIGDVPNAEAAVAEIRQTPDWRSAVRVRTVDGGWRPLNAVLLPGGIFEADEAASVCVDVEYHQQHLGHLERLDVADSPRAMSLADDPDCDEHVARIKEIFRNADHPSSRKPRLNRLVVESMRGVGPLTLLRSDAISQDVAARYTQAILSMSEAFRWWMVEHDTYKSDYPGRWYPGLTAHVLTRYGVVECGDEVVPLSQLSAAHNDTLRRLRSMPTWRQIKRQFNLPDPTLVADDFEALEPEEPERLVDRWPGMRNHLPSEYVAADIVLCGAIAYEGEVDPDTKQYLDGTTVYVVREADEREELLSAIAALDLQLRNADIEEILAFEDLEVRRLREEVRKEPTLEARLLKAVGEASLLRGLPDLLIEYMLRTGGGFRGEEVARAAIHTFDAGVLRHYRRDLSHLRPPGHMAGGPSALAFVEELGFPPEWAGERRQTLDHYEEVQGPFNLPDLHDYQDRIVEQIRAMVLQPSPDKHRALVNLPTGAGKTRVAVQALVSCMVDGFRGDILWVADREELLEQAIDSWQQVWRCVGTEREVLRLTRFFGGHPVPTQAGGPHVIVASIQTLFSRLVRKRDTEPLERVSLIVLDEAHHAIATSYLQLMRQLGLNPNRLNEGPKLLGLTATPYRGTSEDETRRLVNAFQSNRLERAALRDVVDDAPGAVHRYLQHPDLAVLAVADHKTIPGMRIALEASEVEQAEEFRRLPDSAERRLAENAERTKRIIEAYQREIMTKPKDWPTLIFATSVEHAQVLAAELNRLGVTARAISGATDRSTRRRVVEQYRNGEVKVLVNYNVFREGFDAPKTRAVIVARPAFSPNLYFQMIGRGLRGPANGGNADCLIMDVEDNIINFDRALEFTQHEYLWRRRG